MDKSQAASMANTAKAMTARRVFVRPTSLVAAGLRSPRLETAKRCSEQATLSAGQKAPLYVAHQEEVARPIYRQSWGSPSTHLTQSSVSLTWDVLYRVLSSQEQLLPTPV